MTSVTVHPEMRAPTFWRWALMAVFATAVVVGLLGMHTLSTGHAEFSTSSVSAGVHEHSDAGAARAQADAECGDCGSSSHDTLMMVCVLGLLVALVLATRTGSAVVRMRGPGLVMLVIAALPRAPVRPPSLLELSISRT